MIVASYSNTILIMNFTLLGLIVAANKLFVLKWIFIVIFIFSIMLGLYVVTSPQTTDNMFELISIFVSDAYNILGPYFRWVVWLWVAFMFLYVVLFLYEQIHPESTPEKINQSPNYKMKGMHVFLIGAAIFQFGSLIYKVRIFYSPLTLSEEYITLLYFFGFSMLVIGLIIVVWARIILNGSWSMDLYEIKPRPGEAIKKYLYTNQIYSVMRHPIYVGQVFMAFGTLFVFNNKLILIVLVWLIIANFRRALREDAHLKEIFGEEWINYRNKTFL